MVRTEFWLSICGDKNFLRSPKEGDRRRLDEGEISTVVSRRDEDFETSGEESLMGQFL